MLPILQDFVLEFAEIVITFQCWMNNLVDFIFQTIVLEKNIFEAEQSNHRISHFSTLN